MIRAAAAGLLAAELACLWLFFSGWPARYGSVQTRRAQSRRRIARTLGLFGLSALAGLVLLGRWKAIGTMPPEFADLSAQLTVWTGRDLAPALAMGGAGGTIGGLLLTWWRRRRGKLPVMLGDYIAVLPQEPGEAWLALVAALAAGVAEELYFRLALPLLAAIVTGSAAAGMVLATLLFAAAHRYQRWPGVVATGLAGALFAGVYLASGELWLAMALHVGIDINALVLRPWAGGMIRRNG